MQIDLLVVYFAFLEFLEKVKWFLYLETKGVYWHPLFILVLISGGMLLGRTMRG